MRRIVAVARPDKIILFGSAVRGEMGPHSDLDLLVIHDCPNPREWLSRARSNLAKANTRIVDREAVASAEAVVGWAEERLQ